MAEDHGNQSIVERYVRALPTDFAVLAELRHRDFIEEWPQSGERIRGHANYQAIHEHYPGGVPVVETRRIVGSEDRWVATPAFTSLKIAGTGDVYTVEGSGRYPTGDRVHTIFILELREGKVHRQTTYFASPFEAAQWRAKWVERM